MCRNLPNHHGRKEKLTTRDDHKHNTQEKKERERGEKCTPSKTCTPHRLVAAECPGNRVDRHRREREREKRKKTHTHLPHHILNGPDHHQGKPQHRYDE